MQHQHSDESTLKTIGLLYIIFGVIGCFTSLLPLAHIILFNQMIAGDLGSDPPAATFRVMFTIVPLFLIIFGELLSILMIMGGAKLRALSSYNFVFLVAVCSIIIVPIGTALGIITLVMIQKPQNRALFGRS